MTIFNPEFRAAWLKALRSGKYQKAVGELKRKDPGEDPCYCAMGVAMHVAVTQFPELCPKLQEKAQHFEYPWDEGHAEFYATSRTLGLTYPQEVDIISANDIDGKTFAEIADMVEAYEPHLWED